MSRFHSIIRDVKDNRTESEVIADSLALDQTEAGLFCQEIKDLYNKYFPNSKAVVRFEEFLSSYSIGMTFFLGNGKAEFLNRISHNDPFRALFDIRGFKKDGLLHDKMELTKNIGFSFTVDDESIKYIKCRTVKAPFRKVTGDKAKILKKLDKTFKDAKNLVMENKNIIQYPKDLYNIEDKLK